MGAGPDHRAKRQPLDLPGAGTITAALAALLYALTEAKAAGWTALATLGPLSVGLALLGPFVAVERRAQAPLVPLATFRMRPVTVANAAIALESATTAYAFVLTLYFQQVLGLSPLATGLCFLPLAMAAAVAAPMAGRLLDALGGPRATLLQAMTIQMAGLLQMALTLASNGLASVIAATVIWAPARSSPTWPGPSPPPPAWATTARGWPPGCSALPSSWAPPAASGWSRPWWRPAPTPLAAPPRAPKRQSKPCNGACWPAWSSSPWPSPSCWSDCADRLKARKPRLYRHNSLVNVEMVWRAIAASAPTDR